MSRRTRATVFSERETQREYEERWYNGWRTELTRACQLGQVDRCRELLQAMHQIRRGGVVTQHFRFWRENLGARGWNLSRAYERRMVAIQNDFLDRVAGGLIENPDFQINLVEERYLQAWDDTVREAQPHVEEWDRQFQARLNANGDVSGSNTSGSLNNISPP